MLKYKNIFIFCFVSFLSLCSVSCSKILDTQPRQSVDSELAIKDITGLRSLLISCYDGLQGAGYYGQRMMIAPDIMADNLRLTNANSNRYFQERVNTIFTSVAGNLWSNVFAYGTINNLNYFLAGIDNANTNEAEKRQLKGEALFLRGLIYFDMARIFSYEPTKVIKQWDAGIVLRTTPTKDASDANFRQRATVVETYQQIEKDLKESIELLSSTTTRQRANKAAAQAILARVYLYWEKWADAVRLSTEALNTTQARLATGAGYADAFRTSPNPESLFEINYVQATETLGSNESMQSLTTQVTGSWADVVPTDELFNLYEANDVRRAMYVSATKQGERVNFIQKFTGARGPWTDNIPVIRFSEVLLIRAEAYAASGQAELALADLNRIRQRSAATLVTGLSGDQLVESILKERRLELAFEGHRWFDLKRKGRDITKAGLSATVPYTDVRILAPIPIPEIQLNPTLKQNPGY